MMKRSASVAFALMLMSCGGTQEDSATPAAPEQAAAPSVEGEAETLEFVQDQTDMEPTIAVGDRVRVARTQEVRPGQIALVRLPASFNEEGGSQGALPPRLLRVMGVARDTIHQDDQGVLTINGVQVDGEVVPCPALTVNTSVICRRSTLGGRRFTTATNPAAHGETTVGPLPTGHIDVRGDARSYSLGSASPDIGAVPLTAVEGVVISDL